MRADALSEPLHEERRLHAGDLKDSRGIELGALRELALVARPHALPHGRKQPRKVVGAAETVPDEPKGGIRVPRYLPSNAKLTATGAPATMHHARHVCAAVAAIADESSVPKQSKYSPVATSGQNKRRTWYAIP